MKVLQTLDGFIVPKETSRRSFLRKYDNKIFVELLEEDCPDTIDTLVHNDSDGHYSFKYKDKRYVSLNMFTYYATLGIFQGVLKKEMSEDDFLKLLTEIFMKREALEKYMSSQLIVVNK